jgi:translocator protein
MEITTVDEQATPRGRVWLSLLAFLALAYAASAVGALSQGDDVAGRYLALDRPAWAPPSWLFGPVWTVLYALIGVAGWRVWRRAGSVGAARGALGLWGAQLIVNAAWPGVFFGLGALGAGLAVILVLDALVIATITLARRHDGVAAGLLAPYLVWILYATALNAALWIAN